MLLTTTAKVNAVKKLVRAKKYDEALEIADKINPERVASVYDLSAIAEVYMRTGRLEDAKELYLEMYGRNKTHKVMTGLIEICLKLKEPREAEQYLREFRRMEPDNPERLVYRYRVDCMLGKDPEFLIKSLAKLKNEEYTDVWALELAKAYYKNSDREACAKECHQIMKYFPDSEVSAKAKILLGACETDDAPEAVITEATEEPFDTTANVESLMDDVSALLEENALAEAVANETVDEKSIAQAMPAHPEPYLRTPEFLSLHQPAGEDRSIFGEVGETAGASEEETEAEPAEEKAEEVVEAAVAEAVADDDDDDDDELTPDEMEEYRRNYVLPGALEGKIDRVIFDDDDDDDDDEIDETEEADETEETEEAAEVEETEEAAKAEAVEAADEADETEETEAAEETAEDVDAAEEAVETAETEEVTEEEETDEADETDDADEAEDADDEGSEEETDNLPTEEPDSDDSEDDSDEDDIVEEDFEDDGFDDEDSDDDLEYEDDEEEEDDGEDIDEDEADEDEEESDEWNDADDIFGDEDDSEDEDEVYDEENFPEEETGDSTDGDDVVIAESDFADAELEAMAERLGNEVCSATEEAKGHPTEAEEDDAAKMMADTQVVPFVREKQDIPDEDMEKMLYSLLKDIGGKETK